MAITNSNSNSTNIYNPINNWYQNIPIAGKKPLKKRSNSLQIEKELINYFNYDYPQPMGKHPFTGWKF